MPIKPAVSRRVFQIELAVFFLLLTAITAISWSLLSEETKLAVKKVPTQIVSSLAKLKQGQEEVEAPATNAPVENNSDPLPSPSPTILPLPEGKQTYRFSVGKDVTGPKIKRLTLDPLTPGSGSKQIVTLTASHTSPITQVTVEVISENKAESHSLTLISGEVTDGEWQGSWQINDRYDYKYGLRLILESSTDKYDDIMWFRL